MGCWTSEPILLVDRADLGNFARLFIRFLWMVRPTLARFAVLVLKRNMAVFITTGYTNEPLHAPRVPMATDLMASADEMLCAGNWTSQAMCRDKTALFFAPPGERDGRRRRREALASAYCAVCPVKAMCMLAGRQGREHGIWGGENDEERALAGFAPRSPHRRVVAEAARTARVRAQAELDQADQEPGESTPDDQAAQAS